MTQYPDLIEASFIHEIELRRFGINQYGRITYDDFGEPVDLEAQTNYLSWTFFGKADYKSLEDDMQSNAGARSDEKEKLEVLVGENEDIQIGDVLIYPIGSGDSYRVMKDYRESSKRRVILAINENKITK
jgi:hypothetical protein